MRATWDACLLHSAATTILSTCRAVSKQAHSPPSMPDLSLDSAAIRRCSKTSTKLVADPSKVAWAGSAGEPDWAARLQGFKRCITHGICVTGSPIAAFSLPLSKKGADAAGAGQGGRISLEVHFKKPVLLPSEAEATIYAVPPSAPAPAAALPAQGTGGTCVRAELLFPETGRCHGHSTALCGVGLCCFPHWRCRRWFQG